MAETKEALIDRLSDIQELMTERAVTLAETQLQAAQNRELVLQHQMATQDHLSRIQMTKEQMQILQRDAEPHLEHCDQNISNVTDREIAEIYNMGESPPFEEVELPFRAASLLLYGAIPEMFLWSAIRQTLLPANQYLQKMLSYDKINVPEDRIMALKSLLAPYPDFNVEKL